MYLRPVFTVTDRQRIAALIRAHSFGILVTTGPRGLEATHMPFLLAETGAAGGVGGGFVLSGHLAAANPQCAALDGGEALAIFAGPHAYVSPSWYRSSPAVPTWDYAAVHVSGRLRLLTDPAEVTLQLDGLAADDPGGFRMAGMPPVFRDRMMAGIRAFTLTADRVEAQWKMSQNRSADDRAGVIAALRAQDDPVGTQVADLIAETIEPS